jgi:hypothetical protein
VWCGCYSVNTKLSDASRDDGIGASLRQNGSVRKKKATLGRVRRACFDTMDRVPQAVSIVFFVSSLLCTCPGLSRASAGWATPITANSLSLLW